MVIYDFARLVRLKDEQNHLHVCIGEENGVRKQSCVLFIFLKNLSMLLSISQFVYSILCLFRELFLKITCTDS